MRQKESCPKIPIKCQRTLKSQRLRQRLSLLPFLKWKKNRETPSIIFCTLHSVMTSLKDEKEKKIEKCAIFSFYFSSVNIFIAFKLYFFSSPFFSTTIFRNRREKKKCPFLVLKYKLAENSFPISSRLVSNSQTFFCIWFIFQLPLSFVEFLNFLEV